MRRYGRKAAAIAAAALVTIGLIGTGAVAQTATPAIRSRKILPSGSSTIIPRPRCMTNG